MDGDNLRRARDPRPGPLSALVLRKPCRPHAGPRREAMTFHGASGVGARQAIPQ